MTIPIIYIFNGWEPYLQLSVRQALWSNPSSKCYHVTANGARIATGAIGVDSAPYLEMATRLAPIYRHMSVNTRTFELFCLQRWMIAYETMCGLDLEHAVLLDGDVLLWASLSDLFNYYSDKGITWTEPQQPGTVFIANRQTLKALCDSIFWHYETAEGIQRLTDEYHRLISTNRPAAISDMSILQNYRLDNPFDIGDNGKIINGGRFDHDMRDSDGYETQNGLKRFEWREGRPYGRKLDDGALIQFYSMHFVGRSKGYMQCFADRQNLTTMAKIASSPHWIRARVPAAVRKIKDKIRR
jgi:hypothetical protein